MLASTIQQPNNHKKTSVTLPSGQDRLISQGPTVCHPTHPHPCKHRYEQPATDPTTPGPFHTPSKLEQ